MASFYVAPKLISS